MSRPTKRVATSILLHGDRILILKRSAAVGSFQHPPHQHLTGQVALPQIVLKIECLFGNTGDADYTWRAETVAELEQLFPVIG